MKVVGYVRVSSTEDKDSASSPENQRMTIIDFCNKNDHQYIEIFEDINVSGMDAIDRDIQLTEASYDDVTPSKIFERQGLSQLIEKMQTDESIEGIVCTEKSRISRLGPVQDVIDVTFSNELGRQIEILTTKSGKNTSRSLGLEGAPEAIGQLMDEEESIRSSRRARERLQGRKENNLPVGKVPRGLVTDKMVDEDVGNAHNYLIDDENTTKRVCEMLSFMDKRKQDSGLDPVEDYDEWKEEYPTMHSIGKKFGVGGEKPTTDVRNMWKNRWKYAQALHETSNFRDDGIQIHHEKDFDDITT